jgi:multimeric flavodoxin WrbA
MPGKVLGIAGSLRNVISRALSSVLVEDLKRIDNEQVLIEYLRINSELPEKSNLITNIPLSDELLGLYHQMMRKKLRKGMSNSEIALAAGLWAAQTRGADIDYVSLLDHFPPSGKVLKRAALKEKLAEADAILLSGPVYFGDRGSLTQELINLIRLDRGLRDCLQGRLYGGIAVGAKRNGGQETTLIYQILDMVTQGLLAVGNDTDTTSQYGGTCWGGDVGSVYKDSYGLGTAMGTGRRLANLLNKYANEGDLSGKVKVLFVILQEAHGIAAERVTDLVRRFDPLIEACVIDVTDQRFIRCLACDICPERVDVDEVYRCKVGSADHFSKIHHLLLDHDAIVPVGVSVNDYSAVKTKYQVFMERTRYLRRGDYALSDLLMSPLVFQEVGTMENLGIRMITSFVRHHTVVSKPIVGYLHDKTLLNGEEIYRDFEVFLSSARKLAVARLSDIAKGNTVTRYNPVGYVLSAAQNDEEATMMKRREIIEKRIQRLLAQTSERLIVD